MICWIAASKCQNKMLGDPLCSAFKGAKDDRTFSDRPVRREADGLFNRPLAENSTLSSFLKGT